jgi:hypothetical protein
VSSTKAEKLAFLFYPLGGKPPRGSVAAIEVALEVPHGKAGPRRGKDDKENGWNHGDSLLYRPRLFQAPS